MKTNLKIIKIDVTHQWNENFLKQLGAGKVFDYCIYDANQVTHCCEITPSYWIVPVYSETENYLEDVQHEEFMYSNNLEPFYMHCADVERLIVIDDIENMNFEYEQSENEKEYMEEFENVEECLKCNPVY